MDSARITYTPRPGATPEDEVRALAVAYGFLLQAHKEKKGTRPGAPDGVKEDQHAHTAKRSIPG
jgi:hypothetical protein